MNMKLWLPLWLLMFNPPKIFGVFAQSPKGTTQLYGRAEQFYSENGPEFPSFFLSSQKDEFDSDQTKLPKQLIGSWHGEVKMGKWVVLPACADFDPSYDKSVKAISNCKEGKGSLTFDQAKTGVSLKEGAVVFYLPAVYRLDE